MDRKQKKLKSEILSTLKMADKGDQYVRHYTLAPFLFAYSDLNQNWMEMLKASGLLVTQKREESLEPLSDRELDMVDIVDTALNLVLQEFILHSNEKDDMLSEGFEMFDRLESSKQTYQRLLLQASKQKLFLYFWQKMTDGGSLTDVQKFSVVFVLKQYYTYVKNPNLIKNYDRRVDIDTKKAMPWKVKGNDSFRSSRLTEAVSHYTRAIELFHFSHVLYGNRAQACLKIGKYRVALSDSRRAVALKPDWVKGLYRLAEAALQLRMFSRAENANAAGIHICEKMGDPNDDLKDLKDQRLRVAEKRAADEEPDDFLSDVPDLVSSDESSSSDDEIDQLPAQTSQDDNAEAPDFPKELQKCVTEGTAYYFSHKFILGARQFSQALDLISRHGITALNISEDEESSIRHGYILCCIATSSSKWLRAGLKCLENYLQSTSTCKQYRALLLHDRALCYMTLFRFGKAQDCINTALKIISTSAQVENLKWPGKTTVMDITKPNSLKTQLTALSRECLYPPPPEGQCRHHTNAVDHNIKIYQDDPDFKGMVRLVCHENCHVDFHPRCWKDYKQTLGERVVDRGVLEEVCLTPDCTSLVHKIVIFRPDNLPDGKAIISDTLPTKSVLPKEILKMTKVSQKKIQAKLAKKERRHDIRMKASGIDPLPTVTTSTSSSPVPEPASSPLTVSDDRGRTGAEDGVVLSRRDNTDDNKIKAGKVKQKLKKRKDKAVLEVEWKFSDNRYLEGAESAEISQDDDSTSSPFSVPKSLRSQLHKFQESTISTVSNSIYATHEDKVVENTFSFFVDFFSSNGPQPLDSPLLQQFMEDFPEEATSVIERAGGVRQFLLGSLQFCAADNILSLMVDAHKARELAREYPTLDEYKTKSFQPAFQFNPQAPVFTPSSKQRSLDFSISPPVDTEYSNSINAEFKSHVKSTVQASSTMGMDDFGAGDSSFNVKHEDSKIMSGHKLSFLTGTLPMSSGDYSLTENKNISPFSHSEHSSPAFLECSSERPHSNPSFDSSRHVTQDSTGDFSLPRDSEQVPKNAITDIDSDSMSSSSPIFTDSVWSPTTEDIPKSKPKQTEERNRFNTQFPAGLLPPFTMPPPSLPTKPLSVLAPKPTPSPPPSPPPTLHPSKPLSTLTSNPLPILTSMPPPTMPPPTMPPPTMPPKTLSNLPPYMTLPTFPPLSNSLLVNPTHFSPSPPFSEGMTISAASASVDVHADTLRSNREFVKPQPNLILKCQQLERELRDTKEQVENAESQRDEFKTKLQEETDTFNKQLNTWKEQCSILESSLVEKDKKLMENLGVLKEQLEMVSSQKRLADEELLRLKKVCASEAARAAQAELVLLEEKKKIKVDFLEKCLREIEAYCNHLDSYLKSENRPEVNVSEGEVRKALSEWERCNKIYIQILLETNEEFEKKAELVKKGHQLRTILPLQLPNLPAFPKTVQLGHHFPGVSNFPNADVFNRTRAPLRPVAPPQRSARQISPPGASALPSDLFPRARQSTPIRPLVPPTGIPRHRQPLRPLGASVTTYPFKRLPSNLLPANVSSSHSAKTTMELIMERLNTLFPSCERYHFYELIQDYRAKCGGSLSGVPMDKIIEHVIEGIQNKVKEEGSTTRRALRGSGEESIQGLPQEEDPCPICHEEITETDCTTLDCQHRFHSLCIRQWLKEQNTCPNCRTHALLRDDFPSLR